MKPTWPKKPWRDELDKKPALWCWGPDQTGKYKIWFFSPRFFISARRRLSMLSGVDAVGGYFTLEFTKFQNYASWRNRNLTCNPKYLANRLGSTKSMCGTPSYRVRKVRDVTSKPRAIWRKPTLGPGAHHGDERWQVTKEKENKRIKKLLAYARFSDSQNRQSLGYFVVIFMNSSLKSIQSDLFPRKSWEVSASPSGWILFPEMGSRGYVNFAAAIQSWNTCPKYNNRSSYWVQQPRLVKR